VELWIPLAFLVVAAVGSAVYAALRGWALWRTFRRSSRHATRALGHVTDTAANAERHAVALSGNMERLDAATSRLHEGLAELAVLRAAYAEGRELFASIRGTVPRK
jgi:hypothetical protein